VLLLAFDTSTPAVTVALSTGASYAEVAANRHGELLAPGIERVLRDAGVTPNDLGGVVVGLGPGPFTGLRVGVVTARVLSHALGIPAYGACSLDALAAPSVAVVTDARRREVYWAAYDATGARTHGPAVDKPDAVAATLGDLQIKRVRGPGAALYPAAFAGFDIEETYPDAIHLLAAPRTQDLTPLYLRRPDATPPGERKRVTA
jgi:tRNA threonylcarbamoyl adenosine modification protein YeaZ